MKLSRSSRKNFSSFLQFICFHEAQKTLLLSLVFEAFLNTAYYFNFMSCVLFIASLTPIFHLSKPMIWGIFPWIMMCDLQTKSLKNLLDWKPSVYLPKKTLQDHFEKRFICWPFGHHIASFWSNNRIKA